MCYALFIINLRATEITLLWPQLQMNAVFMYTQSQDGYEYFPTGGQKNIWTSRNGRKMDT